ncbi:hypothetical protein HDU76_009828 [Blyttiomyces sp. JEL0837]|nr:hypothetical protein HDU76_009828 [Blyttiomyces sp. JEL0837]
MTTNGQGATGSTDQTTPTTSSTSPNTSNTSPSTSTTSGSSNMALYAGVGVGITLLICAIVFVGIWFGRRKKATADEVVGKTLENITQARVAALAKMQQTDEERMKLMVMSAMSVLDTNKPLAYPPPAVVAPTMPQSLSDNPSQAAFEPANMQYKQQNQDSGKPSQLFDQYGQSQQFNNAPGEVTTTTSTFDIRSQTTTGPFPADRKSSAKLQTQSYPVDYKVPILPQTGWQPPADVTQTIIDNASFDPEKDMQRQYGRYFVWDFETVVRWASTRVGDESLEVLKKNQVDGAILHAIAIDPKVLQTDFQISSLRTRSEILKAIEILKRAEAELGREHGPGNAVGGSSSSSSHQQQSQPQFGDAPPPGYFSN